MAQHSQKIQQYQGFADFCERLKIHVSLVRFRLWAFPKNLEKSGFFIILRVYKLQTKLRNTPKCAKMVAQKWHCFQGFPKMAHKVAQNGTLYKANFFKKSVFSFSRWRCE